MPTRLSDRGKIRNDDDDDARDGEGGMTTTTTNPSGVGKNEDENNDKDENDDHSGDDMETDHRRYPRQRQISRRPHKNAPLPQSRQLKNLGPTATATRSALGSNLQIQSEIRRRLVEVRRRMARNRTDASRVTASLTRFLDHDRSILEDSDDSGIVEHRLPSEGRSAGIGIGRASPPPSSTYSWEEYPRVRNEARQKRASSPGSATGVDDDSDASGGDGAELEPGGSPEKGPSPRRGRSKRKTSTATSKSFLKKGKRTHDARADVDLSASPAPAAEMDTAFSLQSRWQSDLNRKWNFHRFFVDPDGSVPAVSHGKDARGEGKRDHGGGGETRGTAGGKRCVPYLPRAWTEVELDALRKAVDKVQTERMFGDSKRLQTKAAAAKYRKRSRSRKEDGGAEHSDPEKVWSDDALFEEVASRLQGRSTGDCRATYIATDDRSTDQYKFTKRESLLILDTVHRHINVEDMGVDWSEVASALNGESSSEKRVTPWQCFRHHQSKLSAPAARCPPWTPDEDELLLKYLAAHGPAFLFQGDAALSAVLRFFPSRCPKQVMLRASSTLLNPNHVYGPWTNDEERKLALLMRAYGSESSPLQRASSPAHFPRRAPKIVGEKWSRSLNPAVSYRPFLKAENAALLAAVAKENGGGRVGGKVSRGRGRTVTAEGEGGGGATTPWSVIARQFPHRNPDSLLRRWTELTVKQDITKRAGTG